MTGPNPTELAPASPMRLGFAVKVMGQPGLKSNDARKWRSGPHLRVSIGYLRDIFAYLESKDIRIYRMSSDVAPYVTHPDMPQFHGQIRECADELQDLGRMAREMDLRLSFHPSQFVILNSPDEALNDKGIADLVAQAEILDRDGPGPRGRVGHPRRRHLRRPRLGPSPLGRDLSPPARAGPAPTRPGERRRPLHRRRRPGDPRGDGRPA